MKIPEGWTITTWKTYGYWVFRIIGPKGNLETGRYNTRWGARRGALQAIREKEHPTPERCHEKTETA